MNIEKYLAISKQLNTLGDVDRIHLKYKLPKELLIVILTQNIIRRTKKQYNIVKEQVSKLLDKWHSGNSFLEISRELKFSPVMTASLILREMGLTKKQIQDYLKKPEEIENHRIKKEITDILKNEIVYSPHGTKIQVERGKRTEEKIYNWLRRRNISFITEKEARSKHLKTPDFLLKYSIKIKGKTIHWIECKASFGDYIEIRRDYKKQLKHYVDLYSSGMVVYWFGFIDDIKIDDRILLSTKNIFK